MLKVYPQRVVPIQCTDLSVAHLPLCMAATLSTDILPHFSNTTARPNHHFWLHSYPIWKGGRGGVDGTNTHVSLFLSPVDDLRAFSSLTSHAYFRSSERAIKRVLVEAESRSLDSKREFKKNLYWATSRLGCWATFPYWQYSLGRPGYRETEDDHGILQGCILE